MNVEQIRAAKMAELVAFYNAHVAPEGAVKRFRDRATAEQKALAILEAQAGEKKVKEAARMLEGAFRAEPPVAPADYSPWAWPRGVDFGVPPAAEQAAHSRGVAASWNDEKVRAARMQRNGVKVMWNGQQPQEFKSVGAAFRALKLPVQKHIKFRALVKAQGKAYFEHKGVTYAFECVPAA
jgi:hypothetical protein